jgi:hypothetical protein
LVAALARGADDRNRVEFGHEQCEVPILRVLSACASGVRKTKKGKIVEHCITDESAQRFAKRERTPGALLTRLDAQPLTGRWKIRLAEPDDLPWPVATQLTDEDESPV